MKDYPARHCIICGNQFFPRYAAEIVCSAECAGKRKIFLSSEKNKRRYQNLKNLKSDFEAAKSRISELEKQLESQCATAQNASQVVSEKLVHSLTEKLEAAEAKIRRLQGDLAKAQKLADALKAENDRLKKGSASGYKPLEELVGADKIKECKRMNLKALNLPCGLRDECWHGTPCENTAGKIRPKMEAKRINYGNVSNWNDFDDDGLDD